MKENYNSEIVSIPNLENMKQCYGIMRDFKIKEFTKKRY